MYFFRHYEKITRKISANITLNESELILLDAIIGGLTHCFSDGVPLPLFMRKVEEILGDKVIEGDIFAQDIVSFLEYLYESIPPDVLSACKFDINEVP